MNKLFSLTNVIELNSVSSTNEYAAKMAAKGDVTEWTVITTTTQTDGKGRDGSLWESEPEKNLTFSMILYPFFIEVEQQFMLSKVISLGICDYVKAIAKDNSVSIKWPNDIYVNDKKVAGILIENVVIRNFFERSIAGVGLNVNQQEFTSDAPNPVSLKMITGKEFDLKQSLIDLCLSIENRYLQLKNRQDELIDNDYLKSLYRYRNWAKYNHNNSTIRARINGISSFGKLMLETDDNRTIECDMKEISFIL